MDVLVGLNMSIGHEGKQRARQVVPGQAFSYALARK